MLRMTRERGTDAHDEVPSEAVTQGRLLEPRREEDVYRSASGPGVLPAWSLRVLSASGPGVLPAWSLRVLSASGPGVLPAWSLRVLSASGPGVLPAWSLRVLSASGPGVLPAWSLRVLSASGPGVLPAWSLRVLSASGPGVLPAWSLRVLRVPRVCVGLLRVLWFPPTDRTHVNSRAHLQMSNLNVTALVNFFYCIINQ